MTLKYHKIGDETQIADGETSVTFGMDHFGVTTNMTTDYKHINNFNKEKAVWISETNPDDPSSYSQELSTVMGEPSLKNRTIMYWSGDGMDGYTTDFKYHNSDLTATESNPTCYCDRYALKHLVFNIKQYNEDGSPLLDKDGNQVVHHYDGYYLGFDYEFTKYDNQGNVAEVKPDGYYSNWIVKLSAGDPEWTPDPVIKKYRIMCEDLGNTYDFDFNDLVYDVYFEEKSSGKYDAHITIQAVGGTLPIFIGSQDDAHNCHVLMGGSAQGNLYTPVNVGIGTSHTPVDLTIEVDEANPDKIPIIVVPSGNASNKNVFILPEAGKASVAPQKICIPFTDASPAPKWTKEYVFINKAYKHFQDWVHNQSGEYNFGKSSDWTKTDVVEGNLYK